MINLRSQAVDGFGERDDIALEQDKAQGQARDNYYSQLFRSLPDWEPKEGAKKISTLVLEMVQEEKNEEFFFTEDIEFDMSLSEALDEACIKEGLGSEEFSPLLIRGEHQAQIILHAS